MASCFRRRPKTSSAGGRLDQSTRHDRDAEAVIDELEQQLEILDLEIRRSRGAVHRENLIHQQARTPTRRA